MNNHRFTSSSHTLLVAALGLATLALGGVATGQAQTKVIPLAQTTTEGSSSTAFPFAYSAGRTQQIWRGSALTQAVGLVNGVSYRREGTGVAYAKNDFTAVTVSLGLTSVTPQTMSTTFSSNITSTMTTVVNNAKYSLPANPVPVTAPAPFNINVNWTTTFVFDSRKGNLLVEWVIPGQYSKQNPYFLDAERFNPSNNSGSAVPFGTFGKFSGTENVTFSGVASTLKLGGTLDVNGTSFSKNYTAKLILGLSNKSYNSTPLPYDLVAIGAPGNNLYTSMDILLPFPMSAVGTQWQARLTAPIPNDSRLAGFTFYTQSYYADANANAAGLVASNGIELKLPAANPQPETNAVGIYDSTLASGNFVFGTGSYGGPVVQFTGVLP